jgi:hypothetical protein
LSIFRKQLNQREWGRHTESFLVDLRITEEGLLCSNMLGEALNSAVGPMLALAKNSGFSPEWTFQETPVSTICMGKNGLN